MSDRNLPDDTQTLDLPGWGGEEPDALLASLGRGGRLPTRQPIAAPDLSGVLKPWIFPTEDTTDAS